MSIAKMFEAGRMAAREDQERSALAKYLQPALGGDKAAQQAIYGVAPMRGMEVEKLAQQRAQSGAEAARKRAVDLSTVMLRAPQMAAQVYPQFKQAYEGLGLGITLPDQYEEGALDLAKAFAQGDSEPRIVAPGSALVGNDGSVVYERPFAPPKPDFQLYDGADGPVWLPKPGTAPMGAGPAAPPTGGVLDPVRDFGDLGGIPGVNTTSLYRDPERNARVGGVANSFHTKGQAGDFVVPQDQKAQFIQRARDMGYDAIDEGDHVHVEPRRGASAASAFGPGQGVGAIPIQGVRPKPKAGDKPTELERRVEMARGMGATEAELRQMVIGREGAAAGAKPMPAAALRMIQEETNAANTASAINKSLDGHLSRIRTGKLEFGMVSNVLNRGRIAANMSTPEARNYQEFVSDLERLRNDSLRLNSGVQTDGDAQRAWNELVANLNDTQYVKQRLETIKRLNERAESLRRMNVEMIRENYGRGEPQGADPAAGASGGWSIKVKP